MNDNHALPDVALTRYKNRIFYYDGPERYGDGRLTIDGVSFVISDRFLPSPDGRYLAGHRGSATVVVVDLEDKKECAFVAGNDIVSAHDVFNNAFRFTRLKRDARGEIYGETSEILELKWSDAFDPSVTSFGDFTRIQSDKNT